MTAPLDGSPDREPTAARGPARWLVDGNNVMGSRPDGWWRDRTAGQARLAAEVARWAAGAGVGAIGPDPTGPVVLFFDGRASPEVVAGPGVELRFADAGGPDAADDLIVTAAVDGDSVVTADRGLIERLPPGVSVIGPSAFLSRLDPREVR